MEAGAKLNKKAREFKPKNKPLAPPAPIPPVVSESKYFKGVLPGQMPMNRPPPSIVPPGMGDIKYVNGKLVLPDTLPMGLKKLIEQAYDEGKLDDWVMSQMDKNARGNDDYELTEEEEALAQEFLKDQEAMEICPYYLQGM